MNQAVKTGIVTGIAVVATSLAAIFLPPNPISQVISLLPFFIFLAGIYMAIKRTRDYEFGGNIEFKLGLKAGVVCGTISALVTSVFEFVHMTYTDVPGTINILKKAGYKHDDIASFLKSVNKETFLKFTLQMVATYIVVSFIISIGSTLMLRKKSSMLNQQ